MEIRELKAYEVLEEREIRDLRSKGMVLRHKKTGARIVLLSNDDENKVFSIGFRTPPEDSTGVAHIVEHTVLCGSEKYPLKDPFVELVKGSLNTFLNAMTYPDKTVYPVASCNFKDFCNLMDVYLDAVFHPNIYKEEKIFRQEGWHYELDEESGELTLNGVVYNEMKGAFSNPDDVLARLVMNSLYPDTTYGIESGGDPEVIPSLTYENYLDFHRRYYHPSNSYIYLYGDLDMAERLNYLDREYLSSYDALKVDSAVAFQKPFDKVREITDYYPVSDTESDLGNAYLTYNVSLGNNLDKVRYVAFDILDYVICSSPGAVLRKKLIDAGIGDEVFSEYDNGILQPYFSIVAKGAKHSQKEQFIRLIRETLQEMADGGIEKDALLAAVNSFEFKYREADYGAYPRGLMYGLKMLDSWLYEDGDPFRHIETGEVYTYLRAQAEGGTGYFENLIKEELLGNPHASVVVLLPKKGLEEEKKEALKEKLRQYRDSLTKEEKEKIREEEKALRAYQEAPDTEENIAKLPQLTRADLKKEAQTFINEELTIQGTKILFHEIFTNQILYVRLLFDCSRIPAGLFPCLGMLKTLMGLMDTEHYGYGELFDQINLKTGGIYPSLQVYTDYAEDRVVPRFEICAKVLRGRLSDAAHLMEEMLFATDFSDEKRLLELVKETISRMQSQMMSAGHSLAMSRAMSYQSPGAAMQEEFSGLSLYRRFEELEQDFAARKEKLTADLKTLCSLLFVPENLMVDYTGEREDLAELEQMLKGFLPKLSPGPAKEEALYTPSLGKKNEALIFASQVQFVARCGNFRRKGLPYTGAFKVLKVLMGYDYLWNQVRVKGGAYGCMCGFRRNGDCFFVSYRDPHLQETIEVYEGAPEFIRNFDADERTMTKYVIGAVGDMDIPMSPKQRATYSMAAYLSRISYEMMQQERDEVLSAKPEDIRALGDQIEAVLSDQCLCVVGGEGKIREEQERFGAVDYLIHTKDAV